MDEAFTIFADMTSMPSIANVQTIFYVLSGLLLMVHLAHVFKTEHWKAFVFLLLQWALLILWF